MLFSLGFFLYLVCVATSFHPATIIRSFFLFIRLSPVIFISLHLTIHLPNVSHLVLHLFIYLLKTITFYSAYSHFSTSYLSPSSTLFPSDASSGVLLTVDVGRVSGMQVLL